MWVFVPERKRVMALRKVIVEGNETLRKISKPVKVFDETLWQLLDDMYETMAFNYGVGIAAPQVGVLKRAVIVEINNLKLELINPEIISKKGTRREVEGCLSVKGVQGYVTRPQTVTVKAQDRYGNPYTLTGSDYLAQCICHELDHLDGILFIDVMDEVYSPKTKKEKQNKVKALSE